MKNLVSVLVLALFLPACVGKPSLKSSLLDGSSARPPEPTVEFPDLRLGDIRYTKGRLREREEISWYRLQDGTFRRGEAREEHEAAQAVKARIYEVGVAERGRYRGYALERWDVREERGGRARVHHRYFLRNNINLIYLPALAKGATEPFWAAGDKETPAYIQQRWDSVLRVDPKYTVPELGAAPRVTVPGQAGAFRPAAAGESLAETELRLGGATNLASLPLGREVFRVPGDWMVFVYADGLAVPLERVN